MFQNTENNLPLGYVSDDSHFMATMFTAQRIDLVNFLDESSPAFSEFFTSGKIFFNTCRNFVFLRRFAGIPVSLPPAGIGIIPGLIVTSLKAAHSISLIVSAAQPDSRPRSFRLRENAFLKILGILKPI